MHRIIKHLKHLVLELRDSIVKSLDIAFLSTSRGKTYYIMDLHGHDCLLINQGKEHDTHEYLLKDNDISHGMTNGVLQG